MGLVMSPVRMSPIAKSRRLMRMLIYEYVYNV